MATYRYTISEGKILRAEKIGYGQYLPKLMDFQKNSKKKRMLLARASEQNEIYYRRLPERGARGLPVQGWANRGPARNRTAFPTSDEFDCLTFSDVSVVTSGEFAGARKISR